MPIPNHTSFKFKNSIYFISLISLIVVVIWIAFSIYFSYASRSETINVSRQLQPLSPDLHLNLATTLSSRRTITDQELESFKPTIQDHATVLQAAAATAKSSSSTTRIRNTPSLFPSASPSASPASPASPSASPNL